MIHANRFARIALRIARATKMENDGNEYKEQILDEFFVTCAYGSYNAHVPMNAKGNEMFPSQYQYGSESNKIFWGT